MFERLKEALGLGTEAQLKPLRRQAEEIEALEPRYERMSDEELQNQTSLFKQRLQAGESLDSLLNEAFAVVREASRRTLGLRPFKVQLIGGIVLHQGSTASCRCACCRRPGARRKRAPCRRP